MPKTTFNLTCSCRNWYGFTGTFRVWVIPSQRHNLYNILAINVQTIHSVFKLVATDTSNLPTLVVFFADGGDAETVVDTGEGNIPGDSQRGGRDGTLNDVQVACRIRC